LFNQFIANNTIQNVAEISDGDKIKFAYLKTPNPMHDTVIAAPDELPDALQFLDKYIDRETQFQKSFLDPLISITSVIDWNTEPKTTLEDFFS